MHKYILISKQFGRDHFEAEDDFEAEAYVEENYDEDDGEMILYKLEFITGWP